VIPDLTEFRPHRTVLHAAFEGEPVPGLRADFFRREQDGRIATVGCYSIDGRDLLMAWGYVDEEHCRHNAVRDPAGGWHPAVDGCPRVELVRDDGQGVVGLAVRAPTGEWVRG
jgi:uncharacterized protein YjhX (UPF0386 family)